MLIERIALAVVSLTVAANSAFAQADWITPSDVRDGLYDIDWAGGPLSAFLDGIDETTEVSFVVPAVADRIALESFSLSGVWPNETLDVLRALLPGFEHTFVGGRGSVMTEEGVVEDFERPANYIISISNELAVRAEQDGQRFDLVFDGGTVESFVGAIQRQAREKKIVVMPEAAVLPIPGMSLTNVTLADAMGLLDNLSDEVGVDYVQEVMVVRPRQVRGAAGYLSESKAWSVEQIISEALSSDDLLSAIDAAIGLSGGGTRIRYHAETGLLLARGPRHELQLIEAVINRASNTASARYNAIEAHENEAASLTANLRVLETQLLEMKIERDLALSGMKAAEDEFRDLEQMVADNTASKSELTGAQLQMEKKRANLRLIEVQIDNLVASIQTASARLKTLTGGN